MEMQQRKSHFIWVLAFVFCINGGSSTKIPINVTCSVLENVRLNGTPICSIREHLLRRGEIEADMSLRYEMVPVSNADVFDLHLLDLNSSTGQLTTARRESERMRTLDRERTPEFHFIVLVDNAKANSASRPAIASRLQRTIVVNVKVSLLDENDNAPAWPQQTVRLAFSEADPKNASRLFRLAADRDTGLHAEVVYRKQPARVTFANGSSCQLSETDEPFRFSISRRVMNSVTRRETEMGVLSLIRQLDAETAAYYSFELVAADNNGMAAGSLSSTATVIVQVGDVNEYAPVFTYQQPFAAVPTTSFTVNISEAHPMHTPVVTLHATDADADRSASQVTYRVISAQDSPDSVAYVSELTGELFLRYTLDYEALDSTKRVYVVVHAVDSGVPPKTASTTVTVNVVDENDNSPQIRISCAPEPANAGVFSSTLVIEENSAAMANGATDCRITAIDADSGVFGHVYCAVAQSARTHFTLTEQHANRRTPIYRLNVLRSFDFEVTRQFDLPIECWDGANKSSTSMISVVITDLNDCAPEFTQLSYSARIVENSESDTFVAQVRAVDADTVSTSVTYEIMRQTLVGSNGKTVTSKSLSFNREPELLFAVDEDGVVRLVGPLDHETFESVILVLRAIDSANTMLFSTAVLTITVLDVNDCPPVIQPTHQFLISEDAPIGTLLGVLSVSDPDSSNLRKFTFEIITPECANIFRIDYATGAVQLRAKLRRLSRHGLGYLCQVNVSDGLFSVRTFVNVSVVDANDNPPVFKYPSKTKSTLHVKSATLAPGSLLARVIATDADFGANAVVRYALVYDSSLFEINENTGELRLSRSIQVEDGMQIELLIQANDQGSPQKSATATLTVLIDLPTKLDVDGLPARPALEDKSAVNDSLRFSEGMMNLLVTISLVAVSSCLSATFLVFLFMFWRRYVKKRRASRREEKHTVNGHRQQSKMKSGKRHVSIIDQAVDSHARGNSTLSVSVMDELPNEINSNFNDAEVTLTSSDCRERDVKKPLDEKPVYAGGSICAVPISHFDLRQHSLSSLDKINSEVSCETGQQSHAHAVVLPACKLPSRTSMQRSCTPVLFQQHMENTTDECCPLGNNLSAKNCRKVASQSTTLPRVQLRDASAAGKMTEISLSKGSRVIEKEDTKDVNLCHYQNQECSFKPTGRCSTLKLDDTVISYSKSNSNR